MAAIIKKHHQQAIQLIQTDDWAAAHRLIQDYSHPLSCQIHGYLHRIEGDLVNSGYWYHRAGLPMPPDTAAQELSRLTNLITLS
jgi:hypothetical protein